MIVCIDPGASLGLALFHEGGEMLQCERVRAFINLSNHLSDYRKGAPGVSWRIIVERPKHRPNGKARPDDLITLAITAGRCIEACVRELNPDKIDLVIPEDWKGQAPKEARCRASYAALNAAERLRFDSRDFGKKNDDVLDAIGIGLWATKRTDRAGNVLRPI